MQEFLMRLICCKCINKKSIKSLTELNTTEEKPIKNKDKNKSNLSKPYKLNKKESSNTQSTQREDSSEPEIRQQISNQVKLPIELRLKEQLKDRDEILNDETVIQALKRIKDFAEKEKLKSKSKKSKIKEEPKPEIVEDVKSKLKYKGSKFREIKMPEASVRYKLNTSKKASNTVINHTKKFEELNKDLQEMLSNKKPNQDNIENDD